jgi:cytochrome c oxidase assembly protein Cox11
MPVRFVVDASLSNDVNTITLSYAFFNSDKVSAKRYGRGAQAASDRTSHIHPAVPVDELSI